MMSLSYESIRENQAKYSGMQVIMQWLEKGEKPPLLVISGANSECKFWYSRWDLLCIDRGVMCIRWILDNKEELKICLPRNMRHVVLWHMHDSKVAGHMGISKTLARIRNSRY